MQTPRASFRTLALLALALILTSCSLSTYPKPVTPTRPGSVAGDSQALARKIERAHAGMGNEEMFQLALEYSQPVYPEDIRVGALVLLANLGGEGDSTTWESARGALEAALQDPSDYVRGNASDALAQLGTPRSK